MTLKDRIALQSSPGEPLVGVRDFRDPLGVIRGTSPGQPGPGSRTIMDWLAVASSVPVSLHRCTVP